ncbi:MAG: dihydroorotase [Cylindrospermopsis raciborskii KL1]|uniref:dihydroorotase n=1 Tax=Cylindrospermopsis raciborskii TaxID=77022 RepID=UPI001A2B6970|nr:dihydroorotase [Cylindrospermopsis raciborskii]MBG0743340.1 dihydroorotase [Cylindrospermopsis raciborskii KL1]
MIELLKEVRVIDAVMQTDQVADVLIFDGQIKAIARQIPNPSPETVVRDCQGLLLGNGLVDLYSHSGEPGFEERETLSSLLRSAKVGGFTRINVLPDTYPVIDQPSLVLQLQQKYKGKNAPKLQIWAGITLDLAGKQLIEFADLANCGVVGFTDDKPWENLGMVRRILEYLQPYSQIVAFSPCDRSLCFNGKVREGVEGLRTGLPGIPASAETSAIAGLLELVAEVGTPVHIMRVSTSRSVELIARAKSDGLPITASSTWMHLLLSSEDIHSYHTSLHLEPPLGNVSDMKALREGVRQGIIDGIAIDHAAFTYEEKVQAFAESLPGAIGLELALPLLWQNLVETREFTALELWKSLSYGPATCLKQKISPIQPGEMAELTLFNPDKTWEVTTDNLCSLSNNTPWSGEEIKGRVIQIWCD